MIESSNVIEILIRSNTFMTATKKKQFCLVSTKYLKIETVEKKCKALKDLENSMRNKDVSEKYDVPKNTVSMWLKNKENILSDLEKSRTIPKRKKMNSGGYEDVDKAIF